MTLTAVKIKVRKLLPTVLFDASLWFWRNTVQVVLRFLDSIRLLSFKSEQVLDLEHDQIKFKLVINPKNGFIDEYIFLHGIYEDYILDRIAKYLPHNGVFFDVGSNIGQHAIFAAAKLNDTGEVYAFEPVPGLFDQVQKSISVNKFKNIAAQNYACGNDNTTGTIRTNFQNAGQSSLLPIDKQDASTTVEIVKLDDKFKDLTRLDLMKIDVEGFEYEVLLGARKIIEQFRPVILLEFSPIMYNKAGNNNSEKILDFLLEHYTIIDIDDGDQNISSKQEYIKDFNNRERQQTNMLCTPKLN